jgi:hypothetical protein
MDTTMRFYEDQSSLPVLNAFLKTYSIGKCGIMLDDGVVNTSSYPYLRDRFPGSEPPPRILGRVCPERPCVDVGGGATLSVRGRKSYFCSVLSDQIVRDNCTGFTLHQILCESARSIESQWKSLANVRRQSEASDTAHVYSYKVIMWFRPADADFDPIQHAFKIFMDSGSDTLHERTPAAYGCTTWVDGTSSLAR